MLNEFRQWIKTNEGLSTLDAITYGWIIGIVTAYAAMKIGLL